MTLFNVHLYCEMKLRFDVIEADTNEAAADIARGRLPEDADRIDSCEGETFAAFVDVAGDEDFGQSRMIDFDPPGNTNIVITVSGGLVEAVHSTTPVSVFVEDWDCPPDKSLVMTFESEPLTSEQLHRIERHSMEITNASGESL